MDDRHLERTRRRWFVLVPARMPVIVGVCSHSPNGDDAKVPTTERGEKYLAKTNISEPLSTPHCEAMRSWRGLGEARNGHKLALMPPKPPEKGSANKSFALRARLPHDNRGNDDKDRQPTPVLRPNNPPNSHSRFAFRTNIHIDCKDMFEQPCPRLPASMLHVDFWLVEELSE